MKEWDELEQRRREQEQLEASLYRSRSRHHGSGLTEDEQEEREFRSHFPQFNQVPKQVPLLHFYWKCFEMISLPLPPITTKNQLHSLDSSRDKPHVFCLT